MSSLLYGVFMTPMTVSDQIGYNVRAFRRQRGWSVPDLAARCAEAGCSITAESVKNIEHGRKRNGVRTREVTADEVEALAWALAVPPSALWPRLGESSTDFFMSRGIEEWARQARLIEEFTKRQRAYGREIVHDSDSARASSGVITQYLDREATSVP